MIDQPATSTQLTAGTPWKEQLAALIRLQPMRWMMALGIRLFVPGHRVGVALVAFNTRDELLLLRHVFHPDIPWGLPGGWLGRNESPTDGLIRELREEIGLAATIGPPALIVRGQQPTHMVMIYLGWVESGTMKLSTEILEARWFPLSQLPQPTHSLTRRSVEAAQSLRSVYPRPTTWVADSTVLADNR